MAAHYKMAAALGNSPPADLAERIRLRMAACFLARFTKKFKWAHLDIAGTAWTTKILERIEAGQGTMEDLDTLLEIADNMTGKTICVLSDSCATPVVSGIAKFRGDFEALITGKRVHAVPATVA